MPVPFSFPQIAFNIHLIMFTVFVFNPNDFTQLSQLQHDFSNERYIYEQLGDVP